MLEVEAASRVQISYTAVCFLPNTDLCGKGGNSAFLTLAIGK